MYFEDFSDIASFVMPQYVDSNSLFSILCRRLHKKIYGEPLSQKGKQYHLGKRHRLYSLYTQFIRGSCFRISLSVEATSGFYLMATYFRRELIKIKNVFYLF